MGCLNVCIYFRKKLFRYGSKAIPFSTLGAVNIIIVIAAGNISDQPLTVLTQQPEAKPHTVFRVQADPFKSVRIKSITVGADPCDRYFCTVPIDFHRLHRKPFGDYFINFHLRSV